MNRRITVDKNSIFKHGQFRFYPIYFLMAVFLIISAVIRPASAAVDQWELITPNGTSGYVYNVIAAADTYVLLGTDHGIYRSTDRGGSWAAFNSGLTSLNIISIAIGTVFDGSAFAADADTPVFAATADGIFRSTLGGSSWTAMSSGLGDFSVSDMEIDQYNAIMSATTSGIYAGTIGSSSFGIYRSDDSGENWALKNDGMSGLKIEKLTSGTDLGTSHYIFAITDTNKIYAANPFSSSGADESWTSIYDAGSTTTKDIVISPTLGTIAYLATDKGILRGGDPGDLTTWTLINSGLTTIDINSIAHDYSNQGFSYAGSNGGGAFKTIDDGMNWSSIGLDSQSVNNIVSDPTDPTYIYAITSSDIFRMQLSAADTIPGSVDSIAPGQITDLTFNNVATSTLTLNWSATGDDNYSGTAASYDIRYSTSTLNDGNFASATPAAGTPSPSLAGTLETLDMDGLEASTTYYFLVKASDEAFNTSTVSVLGTVTTDPLDSAAPVISSVSAHDIGSDSATISWTTDEGATSQVEYGTTASYGSTTTLDSSYQTSHSVSLTGLDPAGLYHYRVYSLDSSGNLATSSDNTFTTSSTPDNTAPTSPGNLAGSDITADSITVNWTAATDNIAVAGYNIYRNGEFLASTADSLYIDSGLSPGVSYMYTITANDAAGNESSRTSNITLTTISGSVIIIQPSPGGGGGGGGSLSPSDTNAPAIPTNLAITLLSNGLQLTWKNPADADLSGIIVVRKEGAAPASRSDGAKLYQGKAEFYLDNAVDPSKTYYYGLWSYDTSANYSAMASISSASGIAQEKLDNSETSLPQQEASKSSSSTASGVQTAKITNLGNAPSSVVEQVSSDEASALYRGAFFAPLNDAEKKSYIKIVKLKIRKVLSGQSRYAIADFIKYGTPTTKRLGSGERAGVIMSYYGAFKKLPDSIEEWKDIIKIANGRYPQERSKSAESAARTAFLKVYKRQPNIKNAKDNNALMIMAYGLRPAIRNLNSEKAAIKIFKGIFKRSASSSQEWDIVRTIAYSGTKR